MDVVGRLQRRGGSKDEEEMMESESVSCPHFIDESLPKAATQTEAL